MIPKIIHLCWLSGDTFPSDIVECLKSWKHHLNDYEVWLWGKKPKDCLGLKLIEKHFDIDSVIWCKQAYETKKYAFAADYIRLYALYNEGGIYLDSDVIVYKSFNDLLHLPYFIGEDYVHCFEAAIIGCEPGIPWIKDVLDRYEGRSFIKENGEYDMCTLPVVIRDRLVGKYLFRKTDANDFQINDDNVIDVFPSFYFNSRDNIGPIKTATSYCSHNYLGSWLKSSNTFTLFVKKVVPRMILNRIYDLKIHNSAALKEIQIPYSDVL